MSNLKIPNEVYSRCSGYFRPVKQWNPGKQAEFSDRRKMKFASETLISEATTLQD
jgi:anaerobic ribonucleoside-triphosphate reductase